MNIDFTKNKFLKLKQVEKENKIKTVAEIKDEINKRQGITELGNINNETNDKFVDTKENIHRNNVNNLRNINKD